MVTINRMLNAVAEAPGNRSEPNQTEPSRLYAQAQEGAEKKEWDVSNPYKLEKPAKKQSETPKTKGCGPNPKKSAAEVMSYDDARRKAYEATLKRYKECVIEECKAKCGPKPPSENMDAVKEHAVCVKKCEKKEKELGAPKPQKEDPEFKRGNPYLREKKEIKLCDCPPVPKPISGSEMMNPEKGAKYIEHLKRQKLCVEKCKDEGKQVQPYQLQKTEAAPEPKSKPVETKEWGVKNPYK